MIVKNWSVLVLLFVYACGASAAKNKKEYTISPVRWVEEYDLPEEVFEETDQRESFAIEEGEVSPGFGICLSEPLALEYRGFRVSYINLRENYEADRTVWSAHRELYETKLQLAHEMIEDYTPNWWDKHDSKVLGFTGFLLGVAATVFVVR
jgi:hypothetical protein